MDKDVKIDLDKPGGLLGNWFHETLSVRDSSRGEPGVWAKQLSIAHAGRDPDALRISIGLTIAPSGLYGLLEGAPDPAVVGPDTGLVKYRLSRVDGRASGRDRSSRSDQDHGLLLVQLVSERKLKIEYFAEGNPAGVNAFTDKASVYVR